MKKSITKKSQQGMAVIMTVLTMMVTIPLVGLAFDVGVLYMIRGKLYQALDAGALAGARALGQGPDSGTQTSNAQAAAAKYFNANFPSGFWGTISVNFPTPTVDSTSTPNYRTVTTSATITAPLYFLRMLGQDTATIAGVSQAGRRDALVMLVLDRSSSMNGAFQGSTSCDVMKSDAAQFLSNFAQGRDMVGLVIFGSSAFTAAPTTSFGSVIVPLINQINCGGNTNMAEGVHQAYSQIQAVNSTTRANVIVLMTDGRPNGFTGDYTNYRTSSGTCGTSNPPFWGVFAQWSGGPVTTPTTTAGLMLWQASSASYDTDAVTPRATSTCHMGAPNTTANLTNGYLDITQMPPTDVYNNSTTGPYSANNPNYPYYNTTAILTKSGSVFLPKWVEVAAANAVDNQGTVIRSNTTLKPAIYTIALEGNGGANDAPDTLLLRKLANEPTMQNDSDSTTRTMWAGQNPGQTVGFFVDAPDPSQLCAAFNQIATQIVVRLAK